MKGYMASRLTVVAKQIGFLMKPDRRLLIVHGAKIVLFQTCNQQFRIVQQRRNFLVFDQNFESTCHWRILRSGDRVMVNLRI